MNLLEKLIAIQCELKAPKNQVNKFGGYNYRSCEDILEAVKPILQKYKAALVIRDGLQEVCGRCYVVATAHLMDTEKPDAEPITTTAYAREPIDKKGMDDSQITGAASSYARKYALNGLFCIDDTKDADATNDHGKSAPASVKPSAPKAKTEKVYLCRDCNGEITSDDEKWPVIRLVAYAQKTYGRELCKSCMKKVSEEMKNA